MKSRNPSPFLRLPDLRTLHGAPPAPVVITVPPVTQDPVPVAIVEDRAHVLQPFIGRRDVYARQEADGRYTCVKATLTRPMVQAHLDGTVTLGSYAMVDQTRAGFGCIDVDDGSGDTVTDATREKTRKLYVAACSVLPPACLVVEFSGRRGFHIWLTLVEPVLSQKLRHVLTHITRTVGYDPEKIEIFPKQDTVGKDGFGNLVKIPLGIHRGSGARSRFVPPDLLDAGTMMDPTAVPLSAAQLDAVLAKIVPDYGADQGRGFDKSDEPEPLPPALRVDVGKFLEDHIDKADIGQSKEGHKPGSLIWPLRCPWSPPGQSDWPAEATQFPDGGAFFLCQHRGCAGRGWKEFVAKVMGDTASAIVADLRGVEKGAVKSAWAALLNDVARLDDLRKLDAVAQCGLCASLLTVPGVTQSMIKTLEKCLKADEERKAPVQTGCPAFRATDEGKVIQHVKNVEMALVALGKTLRFDEFSGAIFVNNKEVADEDLISLRLEIQRRWDFLPGKELFFDCAIDASRKNTFHQVCEYLDKIPTWDGVPRIDTWLTDYAGVEDSEYVRAIGRKWLIAAVQRARKPGCLFGKMLILEGNQGIGKSPLFRALCPNSDWFHDEVPFNADSQEFIEQTGGTWILECAELKSFRGTSAEQLKANITRLVDRARMAYGRFVTKRKRQFILGGTTNESAYLSDEENNRFWPARIPDTIEETKWRELGKVRDLLWGEASAAEAAGESTELPVGVIRENAREEQAKRKTENRWVEELEDALPAAGAVRTHDLLLFLGFDRPKDVRRPDKDDLGRTMRALEWVYAAKSHLGEDVRCWIRVEMGASISTAPWYKTIVLNDGRDRKFELKPTDEPF